MKTLKTRLIESVMEYISDINGKHHIAVDWETLDACEGKIDTAREREDVIILNISPNAIGHFEVSENTLIFDIRFSGKSVRCFVPTEAIFMVYDALTGKGLTLGLEQNISSSIEHRPEQNSSELKDSVVRVDFKNKVIKDS